MLTTKSGLNILLVLILTLWVTKLNAQLDHQQWDDLLGLNVVELQGGLATQVDYAGMLQQRAALRSYLQSIAAVNRSEFEAWNLDHQLAFLINAYNAWTIELILTEYPDIDSIRDIGFLPGAAWRREIVSLFGEQLSLDDVEHGMIRGWGRYQEPRIHFAVNCAAIGCPALRDEAYDGGKLNQQLEESTRLFLADRSRNYKEGNRLYISRIFDWYEEDFEQGWGGIRSVQQFLAQYAQLLELSPTDMQALLDGSLRIRYADYDWGLNRVP